MSRSVRKAGLILDLFSVDRPEWGPTEVASRLGIAKSSAHSLLGSLAAAGLLEHRPGGRYRLGWRTVELGRTRLAASEYGETLRAVARRLAAHHGETVRVAARDRDRIQYLASERPPGGVAVPARDVPVELSPVGRVLMGGEELAVGEQRALDGVTCAVAAVRAPDEPTSFAVGLCAASDRFARRGEAYTRSVAAAGLRMRRAIAVPS